MRIYIPNKALDEECSERSLSRLAYMPARLDAIQQLKQMEYDLALMSNHGRRLMSHTERPYIRVGSMPWGVFCEIAVAAGVDGKPNYDWVRDQKFQENFFKRNPHLSFLHHR